MPSKCAVPAGYSTACCELRTSLDATYSLIYQPYTALENLQDVSEVSVLPCRATSQHRFQYRFDFGFSIEGQSSIASRLRILRIFTRDPLHMDMFSAHARRSYLSTRSQLQMLHTLWCKCSRLDRKSTVQTIVDRHSESRLIASNKSVVDITVGSLL